MINVGRFMADNVLLLLLLLLVVMKVLTEKLLLLLFAINFVTNNVDH